VKAFLQDDIYIRSLSYGEVLATHWLPSPRNISWQWTALRPSLTEDIAAGLVSNSSMKLRASHKLPCSMSTLNLLSALFVHSLTFRHTLLRFVSFIHIWLYSTLLGHGRFFNFLILYTHGRSSWAGDQPVARTLPYTEDSHTSMPRVVFEPTTAEFERAKTVHVCQTAPPSWWALFRFSGRIIMHYELRGLCIVQC
jgi:hypothetical protein